VKVKLQFLSPLQGEILGSLVLIGFGVWMETRYVSWWSVVGNISGLILALTTLDLEPLTLVLLIIYIGIGIASVLKRRRKLYVLFGSKTYGSLMLILGILSLQGAYQWLNQALVSLTIPSQSEIVLFVTSWVAVAIPVHIIGWLYGRKKEERGN
jgi:uncharacterized membrane protein